MKRWLIFFGAMLLGISPGIANGTNGATALLVGGKGDYAVLTEQEMSTAFGGYFADYDARVAVPIPGTDLPSAITEGADNLYAAVYATPGPKTIGGVSQGAPAVPVVVSRLVDDLNDPSSPHYPGISAEELNVAVYGYPDKRLVIGIPYPIFPESPYDVLIVFAEYDGIADFPDRFSLLAVANATMGADLLHVDRAYYDIRNLPTEYTIVTNGLGGTTTTIMIPTPVLPLLMPMLASGADPARVARMDALLRPIIDSAYIRPDWQTGIPETLTGPPTGSATPATPLAAVTPEPARAEQPAADTHASIAPQPADTPTVQDRSDPTTVVASEDPKGIEESDGGTDNAAETVRPTADDDAIDDAIVTGQTEVDQGADSGATNDAEPSDSGTGTSDSGEAGHDSADGSSGGSSGDTGSA